MGLQSMELKSIFVVMQKAAIYLLIFLVNLNTSFFEEVFKVPVLIQHFAEHQAINNDLTFSAFFEMHYGKPYEKQTGDERDNKLPYKKMDHQDVTHFVFLANRQITYCLKNVIVPYYRINHYKSNLYNNPNIGAFFRPPIA